MNKYLVGSEEDFDDFLNSISKEDKIGLITHVDLDGIASGILTDKILESKGLKLDFVEFLQYGSDVLKPILKKKFDVLFFTDWNVDNFPEDLDNLRKKYRVFVVDHHPPNETLKNKEGMIKTESKYCSAHTLFDLINKYKYFDTKSLEWLVCSTIILDYTFDKEENLKFLNSIYPGINRENVFDSEPGKIGTKIANALIYYNNDVRKVYDFTFKEDFSKLEEADKKIRSEIEKGIGIFKKEAEYFPEKKLRFYYGNLKYSLPSVIASQVSEKYFREETVVFVSDIEDKKDFVKLSSRNQTGNVDLGKILKKSVEGFDDSSAGGHVKAAAGSFPKKYLPEFKKRLLNNL